MRRTERRQHAMRQARQIESLPPEEGGAIMALLLANALATIAVQAALAAVLARAARRGWQQRHLGPARAARSALTPAVGWAAGAAAAHEIARTWGVRALDRKLADTPT